MKKFFVLSLCVALSVVGCTCIECGEPEFSVNPLALALDIMEIPVEVKSVGAVVDAGAMAESLKKRPVVYYVSSEESVEIVSSYNWTASYDTDRFILSQSYGAGGVSVITVALAQDFVDGILKGQYDESFGDVIGSIKFTANGITQECTVYLGYDPDMGGVEPTLNAYYYED